MELWEGCASTWPQAAHSQSILDCVSLEKSPETSAGFFSNYCLLILSSYQKLPLHTNALQLHFPLPFSNSYHELNPPSSIHTDTGASPLKEEYGWPWAFAGWCHSWWDWPPCLAGTWNWPQSPTEMSPSFHANSVLSWGWTTWSTSASSLGFLSPCLSCVPFILTSSMSFGTNSIRISLAPKRQVHFMDGNSKQRSLCFWFSSCLLCPGCLYPSPTVLSTLMVRSHRWYYIWASCCPMLTPWWTLSSMLIK